MLQGYERWGSKGGKFNTGGRPVKGRLNSGLNVFGCPPMAEAPVMLAKESMGVEIVHGPVKKLQPKVIAFYGLQAVSECGRGRENLLSRSFSLISRRETGQEICGNPFIEKRKINIH